MPFTPFSLDVTNGKATKQNLDAEVNRVATELDQSIAAAAAGIQVLPDIDAMEAFYADPDNQSLLVYVNNNNDDPEDPENGIYEYVDGEPRLAQGFYAGFPAVLQPYVEAAEDAAQSSSDYADAASDFADAAADSANSISGVVDQVNAIDERTSHIEDFPGMSIYHPLFGDLYFPFYGDDDYVLAAFDGLLRFITNGIYIPNEKSIDMESGVQMVSEQGVYSLAVTDPNGNIASGYRDGDFYTAHGGPSSDIYAMKLNAQAESWSRELMSRPHNLDLARLTGTHIAAWDRGQSHATGAEAYPAITVARPRVKMVGTSLHYNPGTNYDEYTPFGTVQFNTYEPNTQYAGTVLADAAAEDAIGAKTGALGESCVVPALNHLDRMRDQRGLPDRQFVAFKSGVGSKSIEEMRKGADPEHYNIQIEQMDVFKSIVTGIGGVPEIGFTNNLIGENNYQAIGGSSDKGDFIAEALADAADFNADALSKGLSPSGSPAHFWYQTSGIWVKDDVDQSISQAQLEMCRMGPDNPGLFLAAPLHPVTNKYGVSPSQIHLDLNGQRWLGMQFGKVADHVLNKRLCWEPVSMIHIERIEYFVYILFHAPRGRMQFRSPYVRWTASTAPNTQGIRILDDGGYVGFAEPPVWIASQCLRIRTERKVMDDFTVINGDQTVHGGNTYIADSDEFRFEEDYFYEERDAIEPDSDVPALVDKPYPAYNFAVVQRETATGNKWSRL